MKYKNQSSCPIGIFDSGVGGLIIVKAIHSILPNEDIVYFGDTANMPYGDKSSAVIQAATIKIVNFLQEKHCKLIVIACNSATAAAYDFLKKHVLSPVILMNVVDPVIAYLSEKYANKHVGLIATQQTIRSKIYHKKIEALKNGIKLSAFETRLLAPAIEEFGDHALLDGLIQAYLSHPALQQLDAILLGCTHYPLIKNRICRFYQDKTDVNVIDIASIIANAVKRQLMHTGMLNIRQWGDKKFFVSEYRDNFTTVAHSLFNHELNIEQHPL